MEISADTVRGLGLILADACSEGDCPVRFTSRHCPFEKYCQDVRPEDWHNNLSAVALKE